MAQRMMMLVVLALFAGVSLAALPVHAFDYDGKIGLGVSYAPAGERFYITDRLTSRTEEIIVTVDGVPTTETHTYNEVEKVYFSLNNMALLSARFGLTDSLFLDVNPGFYLGEQEWQQIVLNARLGLTFVTVGDANFYGLLGTTLAFANNDVNPVDVAALEVGVGAELFMGDKHTVGLFGEYAGTMYFAPAIMFSFMSGFRVGLRYYFDIVDTPVGTAPTGDEATPAMKSKPDAPKSADDEAMPLEVQQSSMEPAFEAPDEGQSSPATP